MPKADDPCMIKSGHVHAKATVVFRTKGDCRRYVGPDYADRYVNGVVKGVDYRPNKNGKPLAYPVIDFQCSAFEPKRVVLALSQVLEGKCPGEPTDERAFFFKMVGSEGMKQTQINNLSAKISPKK